MKQPSLRERKKIAAMHTIQETAVNLFERDGFDTVTIDQVAAEADVSPSTVYRYFGTKEGLVLHDELDDGAIELFVMRVAAGEDPAVAMRATLTEVLGEHFHPADEDLTRRRTLLWMGTPAIRRAGLELFDDVVEQVAVALSEVTDADRQQSRLAVSVTLWPLMAAIRNWHEDGARVDGWFEHLQGALAVAPQTIPGWPGSSPSQPPTPQPGRDAAS